MEFIYSGLFSEVAENIDIIFEIRFNWEISSFFDRLWEPYQKAHNLIVDTIRVTIQQIFFLKFTQNSSLFVNVHCKFNTIIIIV